MNAIQFFQWGSVKNQVDDKMDRKELVTIRVDARYKQVTASVIGINSINFNVLDPIVFSFGLNSHGYFDSLGKSKKQILSEISNVHLTINKPEKYFIKVFNLKKEEISSKLNDKDKTNIIVAPKGYYFPMLENTKNVIETDDFETSDENIQLRFYLQLINKETKKMSDTVFYTFNLYPNN
ncbi:hypothetical protein [Capnocytophaga sp. oral taxon 903]|jgi:hypothetical protein|uniref:hypothetical protein n=1 Tax=Capnocytophaga sp. oral taxon 903 TaxID=2748317 RepID=UPI0015BA6868|nr:hypothetical protein [Capnocytophaga sp. oral taxon 903]NWO28903.1 hypothetical protein [Capnocytophaga sp. oral taxon 903]